MVINWPKDLVSDIARRRCVLFLGSGISAQSKNALGVSPKNWEAFLRAANRQLILSKPRRTEINQLINNRDYLTACQVIKDIAGDAIFHGFVQAEFLAPGFDYAPIHDSIINLDSRIVDTPNFDKIFDVRINHLQANSVAVKNYYDNDVAECIRGVGRAVIKIHGTIDSPNRMIFTRHQYARARYEYRNFYAILEAFALTQTFLFLGCGLDDPDIRLVLEDYAFKHDFAKPHYFVVPTGQFASATASAIEKGLNIKFLRYSPIDDHRLLKDAIDELIVEVNLKRQELRGTSDW